MLVPSLKMAKAMAREVVCRVNARSQVQAQALYSSEYDGKWAPLKLFYSEVSRAMGIGLLAPYLGGTDVDYNDPDFGSRAGQLSAKYICPALDATDSWSRTCVVNGWNMSYAINLPVVDLTNPAYVPRIPYDSADWLIAHPYWVSWMHEPGDLPVSGIGQDDWAGRWPDDKRVDPMARFRILLERPVLWYGGSGGGGPGEGYDSAHQDNSLTHGYADGHVESGFWHWYMWTE